MALTIRLNEEDQKTLWMIQSEMGVKTGSEAIKEMIRSWEKMISQLEDSYRETGKLRERATKAENAIRALGSWPRI